MYVMAHSRHPNCEFKNQLLSRDMDLKQVQSILQIMRDWKFEIMEIPELTQLANEKIYAGLVDLANTDENVDTRCADLITLLTIVKRIPLALNLWRSQNFIFSESGAASFRKKLANGSLTMDTFQRLLQQMGIASLDKQLNPV